MSAPEDKGLFTFVGDLSVRSVSGFPAQPGSLLAQDDEDFGGLLPGALAPTELGPRLLTSTASSLAAVVQLAFEDDGMPRADGTPVAALIRSALETAASGIWLLLPHSREVRRARYNRFSYTDYAHFYNAGPLDTVEIPSPKEVAKQLTAVFGANVVQGWLKPVGSSTIIREVDQEIGSSAHLLWQLLSGATHGQPWTRALWMPAHRLGGNGLSSTHYALGGLGMAAGIARVLDDLVRFRTTKSSIEVEEFTTLRYEHGSAGKRGRFDA